MSIKIQEQTPTDWVIRELIRNLSGATWIRRPPDLTPDQETSLRNALAVPGVHVIITEHFIVLNLPEEFSSTPQPTTSTPE